ncbi:aldose 1-epimerase family protein [Methylobrevis albus]|uniref:Aldose 1-epimerase family protein n=1 Tax=Methylobrevis albus TaxID=2793297 RepID=A0A931HZ68_9HYPH|nr:aldose 1-epimerase family protein [Methylobrevis albus]MBH0236343.1 aldose 1-epimerase family protein [Methylobrevis albus]
MPATPPTDLVTIASADLSAAISPDGAELRLLQDAAGRDLLWDGDPAVWAGRAPILFPIVGTVAGDRYRIGDANYNLPRHGFARRRRFEVVEVAPSQARFRLEDDAETRAVYPFAFRLDLVFALDGTALAMTATVTNRGDAPMPASFGFHPAFRWPLPYGAARSAHIVRFDVAEPAPVRRLDATGLVDPVPRDTPVAGRDLALADELFTDDAIIFDRLAGRGLVYGAPGHPGLVVHYPAMPELGLWSKPGAGYLCIEPWQGHADPAGFAGTLFEKPGIVVLAPGEARDFAMTVRLDPDPLPAG